MAPVPDVVPKSANVLVVGLYIKYTYKVPLVGALPVSMPPAPVMAILRVKLGETLLYAAPPNVACTTTSSAVNVAVVALA